MGDSYLVPPYPFRKRGPPMRPFRLPIVISTALLLAAAVRRRGRPGQSPPPAAAGAAHRPRLYHPRCRAGRWAIRGVSAAPELEMLPLEIIAAAGMKELGLDPTQIEEILVTAEIKDLQQGPRLGRRPLRHAPAPGRPPKALVQRTVRAQFDGKTYRAAINPTDASLMLLDDRTILVATTTSFAGWWPIRRSPRRRGRQALGPDSGRPGRGRGGGPGADPAMNRALAETSIPAMFAGFRKLPEVIVSAEAQAKLLGRGTPRSRRARDAKGAEQNEVMLNAL